MELQQFLTLVPHIDTLNKLQTEQLLPKIRELYSKLDDCALNNSMYRIVDHITKLKAVNSEIQQFLQQCMKDAIRITIRKKFAVGHDTLRLIFNAQADYYKYNRIDQQTKYPLGLRHPIQHYEPEVGQQCDIVKPYLSSISYCGWTRATIVAKQGKKYIVKYANTQLISDTRQQPFCAPLGTRTEDFQWRINLKVGDQLDAFHKVWWKGIVKDIWVENSIKRIRVTFKFYSQNGAFCDNNGNRYDGLADDQDQCYEITSYRIQRPGKMAKKFCLYSLTSEEFLVDDTYDLIFQNQYAEYKFNGIMRLQHCKSLTYLEMYETFCQENGNEAALQLLLNYKTLQTANKDCLEPVFNTMIAIANSSFLVPRMAVHQYFPQFSNRFLKFIRDNPRFLSPQRNDMAHFTIDIISKRWMSLTQKHLIINDIRKTLILQFLKLNMEKQMIALRLLYELINPFARKYTQIERLQVNQFLRKKNIFSQLINPSTHESILLRSTQFIRYLLCNKIIQFKQIEYLWNIFPVTDLRGKSTVQKMIAQLSKSFSIQDNRKVIDKILSYHVSQLTIDNLTLLRFLKDHQELLDQDRLKILQAMWEIIATRAMNVTQQIEEEIQKVFKSIIPSLKSNETKLQLLKLILDRLSQAKILRNEFDILKQFLMSYPKTVQLSKSQVLKIQQQESEQPTQFLSIPQTISQVVDFLKQNNIYQTIINIFNQLKTQNKMKNVLWFTSFLFQNDNGNIDEIVKVFYDKMGPSDIFFDWAQHINSKAHKFFLNFLNYFELMNKFEQLSYQGFNALKLIIFDVNVKQGNLKIIKKTKSIAIQSDSKQAVSSQKLAIFGPVQKPTSVTYLYLQKSPYQCIGIQFLQQLLLVVKNSRVYDQIIKLIIEIFVNLDESIQNRTRQFREQFLMDIFTRFKQINQRNQFNDQIKLRLSTNLNLLHQLFSETQKDGLFDIKPHFQCVQGDIFKFKIENHIINNKLPDTRIEINQNCTLYSLKLKIAEAFKEKPQDLTVTQFTKPVADQFNGKSLADLRFHNDETLNIQRKGAKQIPRKQLLNQTGEELCPRFNEIVDKWFHTYKNSQQLMGIQQLKKLSQQLWRGSALKEVSKLNEIIQKFDKQGKGSLTYEQFKQFFIFKSSQNPSAIWKILNLSGYKNNLRYKDEVDEQFKFTADICPRRILSTPKVYEILYSILGNNTFQPVHLLFYRFLSQLQTDTTLKQQVKKNAKPLIEDQTSAYKLSYILETVLSQILTNEDFFEEFYKNKGCQFIIHKLRNFMSQSPSIYTLNALIKCIIMPNMLKILNTYLFCLHSSDKKYQLISKVKINGSQLDAMIQQLKNIQKTLEDQNEYEQKRQKLLSVQSYFTDDELRELAESTFVNLVSNYNIQLLQKVTNETVRMYCLLTIVSNRISPEVIIKSIKSESLNYRRTAVNLTYLYLLKNPQDIKPFLQLLLQNLPQQNKNTYSYYFILLDKILEMHLLRNSEQKDDSEFIELTSRLFKKLFEQLPNESRNAILADKLLFGVLGVINTLLVKRQGIKAHFKYLKKDLLEKCLFFCNPLQRIAQVEVTPEMLKTDKQANHFKDYVKCKSQETRKILMEIIFHLHQASAQEDPEFIDHYILSIYNDLPKNKKKFDTRSQQVGLANLGSTCYLNSMMQLLNSVPAFRNLIMQSKVNQPLVRQLKTLFGYLYFSERQDYVPQNLLQSFIPPILKGIQQDTTQFLNILFDQLDNCLRNTSQHNLLQEIFQGTQTTQMICSGCGKKRERPQTFFTYTIDIEDKMDLNTALQGMHTGEVISDCACQYCGQRTDTKKRTIIEKIPNVFFIPLKRIVFNYDMFINTKIHTRLQFPAQLNFQPYTKEGVELRESLGVQYMKNLQDNEEEKKKFEQLCLHQKPKEYYKLKLKGIIVHSGGPQVGHYWAITKNDPNWLKFDDSRVSLFTLSSMQSECFGGNYRSDEWGGMGSSTNAYVLLYEKQLKTDIVLGSQQNKKVVQFNKIQTYNTTELYKEVWLDNHSLMLENHLLKQSYCKQFIHFLVNMLKITPSNNKIVVIAETLYKVCYHSGQTGKLIEALISNLDQINSQILNHYIINEKGRTFQLLFHNNSCVRDFTAVFIEKVCLESWKKGGQQQHFSIKKFIDDYLKELHNEVAKNWLRIDGYFRLFEGLVTNSVQIRQLHNYLLEKHLISYFIDFIMQKSSPLNIFPKKYSIGTKSNPAHFGFAINLILFLIKRSYGFIGQNFEQPPIDPNELFHLSNNDIICLSSIAFYEKMLRQRQNLGNLGFIIQRLAIKNLQFSEAIARVLLSSLNQITDPKDQMNDICLCIYKFLTISDEFWISRAEFVIGYSCPSIFNDNLLNSIDEDRFSYNSTLQDIFPIECLLAYAHINKLRNPLAVLHILKTILDCCNTSDMFRQYLLNQKSPSYIHERYIDWIKPYINMIVETLNLSKEKKESVIKEIQICNLFLNQIQLYKRPITNVITGKILNQNVVDRFVTQQIEVVISNVESYLIKSQPTGFGNKTFDQFLVNGRLNKKVTKQSNVLCFFKELNKVLAIKQNIEQAEDKQLLSLFDDCVPSKPVDATIQSEKIQQVNQPTIQKIVEEISQITQQSNKQNQEEPVYQINLTGMQLSPDYFRKIQIINNQAKTKRVTLYFKTNQNSNILVPSKLYFLASKKAVQTIWVCKIDEQKGWGYVDYQLIVEQKQYVKHLPKSFLLYEPIQKLHIEQYSQKMELEGPVQQANPYETEKNVPNNDPQEDYDEIECKVCTLLNLSTSAICQACGSPFN